MDQEEMSPETYLRWGEEVEEGIIMWSWYFRVTIRSRTAFKGFLMRAESATESHLGSWYIPYLADTSYLSESQYLHCHDILQSAVTHSGRTNNIWVVSFQWRPPQHFSGPVRFRSVSLVLGLASWISRNIRQKFSPDWNSLAEISNKNSEINWTNDYNVTCQNPSQCPLDN